MTRRAIALSFAFLLLPLNIAQSWGLPEPRDHAKVLPGDHAPIAVIGEYVYSVAEDKKHLIRKHLGFRGWEPYKVDTSFGEIAGLAVRSNILYVVDNSAAAVLKVQDHIASPVFVGHPLLHPREISTGGDELYILDGTHVFRLDEGGLSQTAVNFHDVVSEISGGLHLGSSNDELALTNPSQGVLLTVSEPDTLERASLAALVCRVGCLPLKSPPNLTERPPVNDILPSSDATAVITRPGPVSVRSGIIYVVDEDKHQLFASSRHILRPVRLVSEEQHLSLPSSIVVTETNLIILDDRTHDTVSWQLLVPAEVVVGVKTTEPMAALYNYLHKKRILPTRRTVLESSIEKTLRRERVLLSPYAPSLDALICSLNPGLCIHDKPKKILPSGVTLTIPDVYSESFVDAHVLRLDGVHSLKFEIDRTVKSDALQEWKTEERLSRMNPQFRPKGGDNILAQYEGTFTIPAETVRYFIGMPAAALKSKHSAIAELRERYKDSLTISSIEELKAKTQDDVTQYMVKCDQESFKAAYKRLLTTINYEHPSTRVIEPSVGVAESLQDLDCNSPDFDGVVCSVQTSTVAATPQSIAVIPAQQTTFRNFAISDHANAVASLIAARHTGFDGTGLAAPETLIVPVANTDPPIADDIRRAALAGTRIFNLSLAFDDGAVPPNLGRYINHVSREAITNALFVVSAPDDGKQVCGKSLRYPICWGDQSNVIVVAATLIDGSALIPSPGGSAWGQKFVHIAAPGIGFGASGRDRGYVPVAGTSFAAPLVTAAAALLFEQGLTDAYLIKQRLIATSKVVPDYQEKILGGLLDVKHAVSNLGKAVMVDFYGNEKPVRLLLPSPDIHITWSNGETSIPVHNILRLTRNADDQTYRIVYQDPNDRSQLWIREGINFDPNTPWRIKYAQQTIPEKIVSDDLLSNYKDYFGPIFF